MSADGKTMDVNVHFEDPGAFNMPWDARQHYARSTRGVLEETVCAESAGRGTDVLNWGLTHAKELAPFPEDDKPVF